MVGFTDYILVINLQIHYYQRDLFGYFQLFLHLKNGGMCSQEQEAQKTYKRNASSFGYQSCWQILMIKPFLYLHYGGWNLNSRCQSLCQKKWMGTYLPVVMRRMDCRLWVFWNAAQHPFSILDYGDQYSPPYHWPASAASSLTERVEIIQRLLMGRAGTWRQIKSNKESVVGDVWNEIHTSSYVFFLKIKKNDDDNNNK